jgi:uncharacterized protein
MARDAPAPDPSAPPTGRHTFVDALRGFALFGVMAANLLIFSGITYMNESQRAAIAPSSLDRAVLFLELLFIENKFIGLFSTLFGVSFWLFLSRAQARGASATVLFYRRIGWLFVIGCLHGWLLWAFDVLRFYALWAVLLPLFVSWRPRRLLAAALAASTLIPALVTGVRVALWPGTAGSEMDAIALAAFSTGRYREMLAANWTYDWYLTNSISQIAYQVAVFGRLLMGLYLARTLAFDDLERHRPLFERALVVSAIVGVAGNTVFATEWWSEAARADAWVAAARRLLVESGFLALTLTYAAALALAFQRKPWREAIARLAPLGQMALTWYLLQTVAGLAVFYGFAGGLMGRVTPTTLAIGCVLGYVLQVALARARMRRFQFGPAEWAWRSLTYGTRPPLRRSLVVGAEA